MQAAQGVGNMTLAHEIVVDPDFRFNKQEPPPNRLVVLPRMHDSKLYSGISRCMINLCMLTISPDNVTVHVSSV